MFNRCGVMALVAAYLNFLSQMIANPPFCQHISKVSEVPQFLLLLVPASDGSLFSGDRAEEPDGAVSAPRTRVQRQVSVSLRLVDRRTSNLQMFPGEHSPVLKSSFMLLGLHPPA